jgi:hypothetical protein
VTASSDRAVTLFSRECKAAGPVEGFSHHLILETESDWRKSWREFFMPTLSAAAFIAEALKVFVETFPETKSLLIDREQTLIENYRGWLRDKRAQPK